MMRTPLWLVLVAACGGEARSALVRVDPEVDGVNCPDGGVAIHTGDDLDGDRFLDEDEITSTQFVCNGAPEVQCAGGTISTGTIIVRDAEGLAALAGTNCVDGDLLILGSPLESLEPLGELATVTGDVVIAGNADLLSLDGLANLRDVGRGYLVQGNPRLTELTAIGTLRTSSQIAIVGNDGLTDLRGLEPFHDLAPTLTIANNGNLESLAGLDNLTTAARTITIRGNRSLTSVAALDHLRAAHIIEISGSPELETLELAGLERLNARLLINTNANLRSIEVPALTTIGEFIEVKANNALISVNAPNLLTASAVVVTADASLESVSAPNLVLTSARIELANLARLNRLELGSLLSVGDALVINNVPLLPNLQGLSALTAIGGSLTITRADALTGFSGLGALEKIAGDMTVSNNARLSDFDGLSALTEVGNNLTISGNPMLAPAEAQAFASRIAVGGTTTIQ